MAKLLSYYSLCPIADMKDFLGVTNGKEPGTVINTLGRNIVIITKLNSQKQLKSWTVLDKLSTPVVYDASSGYFVAIFGQKTLKYWDEAEVDLKKAKKIKLQKPIKTLIPVRQGGVLLLYEDGSSDSLAKVFDAGKSFESNKNTVFDVKENSIIKAAIASRNTDKRYLTTFTWNTNSSSVEMFYSGLDDNLEVIPGTTNRIKLNRKNVKCVGYCVVEVHQNLFLLSIWSDKRMLKHEIKNKAEENDTGHLMAMLDFLSIDQPLSVVGIAKNYIAIYGANAQHEGSSLILYNVQYSLVEAKQYFKVFFNNSTMWTIDDNILLAMGQSLSVIPIHIADEQLINIMGSKMGPKYRTMVEKNFIDEDGDNEMRIQLSKEMTLLSEPMPPNFQPNKPIPLEVFDRIWKKAIDVQTVEIGSSAKADFSINGGIKLSNPIRKMVEVMENQGCSEIEITSQLIPICLATNSSDLIEIFKMFENISEVCLINCLKYAMDKEDNVLVVTVLAKDFDELHMVQQIREKMSLEEDVNLLKILYEVLTGTVNLTADDEIELVLKWLACILDAHFSQFVLSKSEEVFTEFFRWKCKIDKYVGDLEKLNKLSAVVANLAAGQTTGTAEQKHQSKWYNVELISLQ